MPIQARLKSLQNKKEAIEELIEQELKRVRPDEAKIAQLKKEKLAIKEEMDSIEK